MKDISTKTAKTFNSLSGEAIKAGEIFNIFTGKKDVNETTSDGEYTFFSCSPNKYRSDSYIHDGPAIIITGNGSYTGTVRFFDGKFDLYQRTYGLTLKDDMSHDWDIKFLYFYFKIFFEREFMGGSCGSSIPYIIKGNIENFQIPLFGLSEQKQIAEILSSLDDKIELNRSINDNLEAMASALFKKLFTSADDSGSSNLQQPRQLNNEIKELTNGDWGKEQEELDFTEQVFCIRGADIKNLKNGGIGRMPVRYIKYKNLVSKRLCDGDIVIEISGGSPTQSTGRSMLITDELLSRFELPLICSNFCKLIRLKNTDHSGFYYALLKEAYNKDEFFQYENGTSGIKNLDLNSFLRNFIFKAQDLKILKFNAFFSDIYKSIQANGTQNIGLSIIKESLLYRLMDGRIRVKL